MTRRWCVLDTIAQVLLWFPRRWRPRGAEEVLSWHAWASHA